MEEEKRFIVFLCLTVIFLAAGILSLLSLSKLRQELVSCQQEVANYQQQAIPLAAKGGKTKAIMMLIEYKDTIGLVNFVNDLDSRDIYSLLSVSPDFVEENCQTIKSLLDHRPEIVSQNPAGSFWDQPYEEQLEAIKDSKSRIEACTGRPLKIISSRYFASDENTVKIAEELDIPFVLARGTSGTEAIVFQPEEYPDVKIISVSNIPTTEFEYGSLCDYSYWVREGTPEDMEKELLASLANNKLTPVSHTNLGGFKARWNQMWLNFFDTADVDWVSLEEFTTVDKTLPMWRIPRNQNAPYTPQGHFLVPYDEEENLENPCAVEDLSSLPSSASVSASNLDSQSQIIMFHNGKGPMCIEAVDFLETINYASAQVLTTEPDFSQRLTAKKEKFTQSEGISDSFGLYPIIFIKNRVFSGFSEQIKNEILKEIGQLSQTEY